MCLLETRFPESVSRDLTMRGLSRYAREDFSSFFLFFNFGISLSLFLTIFDQVLELKPDESKRMEHYENCEI